MLLEGLSLELQFLAFSFTISAGIIVPIILDGVRSTIKKRERNKKFKDLYACLKDLKDTNDLFHFLSIMAEIGIADFQKIFFCVIVGRPAFFPLPVGLNEIYTGETIDLIFPGYKVFISISSIKNIENSFLINGNHVECKDPMKNNEFVNFLKYIEFCLKRATILRDRNGLRKKRIKKKQK